jgi:hypothetical protein
MAAIKTTGTFRRSAAHTRIHRCSALEIHDIEWRAELERRTVLGWPGVCCPDDRTWQSNSIFTTKFKFSFVKSSLMGRTNCGLRSAGCCIQATRIQHTAVEPRIRSLPSRQQLKVREIMCQGTDLIVAK